MDNLYMSVNYACAAYSHQNQVLIAGVTRIGMKGLPQLVMQEEVKTKSAQISAHGTVKEAILEGDDHCLNIVVSMTPNLFISFQWLVNPLNG
jgi:hypothetical protein